METNINENISITDGKYRHDSSVNYSGAHSSWRNMAEHLYADIATLYEKQNQLMVTEIKEKMAGIMTAMKSFAIGGSMLFVGVFVAAATAIICLDLVMPLWASALIVTAVLFIVGGLMVVGAKRKLDPESFVPTHSIEAMGEIKNTFKERFNEFKSYGHH